MSKKTFFDLKFNNYPDSSYNFPPNLLRRKEDEFWKDCICSTTSVSTKLRVQQMCYSISRELQGSNLFVLGSVSMYVLCPIDISGKPAGYRNLPELSSSKALSYWFSWSSIQVYSGLCQRNSRLPHLSRLWSYPYKYSMSIISGRGHRTGYKTGCICPRFNYYRPLSVNIPLGKIPQDKGSYQITYPSQPVRTYTCLCGNDNRKDPRYNYYGYHTRNSRFHLYNGQGLPRLRKTISDKSYIGFLRNSCQKQYEISPSIFKSCRQDNRNSSRPNYYPHRNRIKKGLSRAISQGKVLRYRKKETAYFSDKSFCYTGKNSSRYLSLPMAGGTVFQMGQTTPANQVFLWHIPQCSQDTDMDSLKHISSRSDSQKEAEYARQPPHNFANFRGESFREKAYFPSG